MTDKILIDRSVVEQALEALDEADLLMEHRQNIELRRSALVALSAALEQPQVEQEPVAWAVMQGGAICWEADYPFSNEPGWCDSDQQSVPLYIHPQPPRQPLTEDGIKQAFLAAGLFEAGDELAGYEVDIARAIEAAHGITGEQE